MLLANNYILYLAMRFLVKRDFIAIIVIGAFFASILLSSVLIDSAKAADDGRNEPQLAPTNDLDHFVDHNTSNYKGMRYDESSVVRGTGDVSIRGSFNNRAADSSGWLKGNGSINLESQRSMSKSRATVNFNQKSDLVFQGGQLISIKSLQSPLFYGGNGASVNEWSNLSHVDKSETDIIRSINRLNNTLVFDTEMAFDGMWDLENQVGSGFSMKKGEQRYSGSFQTQKKIEFIDSGKE